MRVDAVTPVVAVAPGERAVVSIRIHNDGRAPAVYRARVLGVDGQAPVVIGGGAVAPGVTAEVDLAIEVPLAYATGRHAVAIEVASDRPGEATALAALTLAVDNLERVHLRITPSTIRGRRRGKFRVELDNRGGETVDLGLAGEGHGLRVRLKAGRVLLRPGERAVSKGSVKGPLHVFGETDHHVVEVVARGHSAPRQTTAAFLQRPLFPRGARTFLAAFLALALWASAVGIGAYWWTQRDDTAAETAAEAEAEAAAAQAAADTAAEDGEDGAGGAGAGGGAGGGGGEGAAGADEGAAGRPSRTLIGGRVKAGETGDDADVKVSLAPIDLGAPPPEGAVVVNPGESVPAKLWPARFGRYAPPGAAAGRQTVSIETATTGDDGVWLFGDVAIRQDYEVHFAKEGYDSRSFVVTPTADGKPVELEVALPPGSGALGGRVFGPGGPLGGVDIVVTDGTLRFTATTSTAAGSTGQWAVGGVSSPAAYTITASLAGFGTEVIQTTLDPGEQRTDLRIEMSAGVGSIGGRVTFAGAPLPGITLTAFNGDVTRTTSTLTEGDAGSYLFPKLPVPGDWTVTVGGEGYVTQTRRIALTGNATAIDFDLVRTTATLVGVVVSDVSGPLPGAAITIARDKLTFRTATAVSPDPGSFEVGDLPPGTYLVSFSRFDHPAVSQLVTLEAGEVRDLGQILLTFQERPPLAQTGRLVVRVLDSVGSELNGASITVTDVATGNVVRTADDLDLNQSTFAFDDVPIGTYEVRVNRNAYRTATSTVSIGLSEALVEFRLLRLGQASGRILDSITGQQLDDYEVTISRLNPDGSAELIQRIGVPDGAAPNAEGEILWESAANSLTTGTYRVDVSDPPPGHRVINDQVLDPSIPAGQPRAMLFIIRPDQEDPLRLADIEADPLPSLSGRIYVPGPRDPPRDQTCAGPLCPIDAPMTVTLDCASSPNRNVPAVLTDQAGDSGAAAFDTYLFDANLVDVNNLLGACTLKVTSGGYVDAVVPLRSPMVPSDGDTRSDQVVNVALVAVTAPIRGELFWLDFGVPAAAQEIPIDGAQISTGAAVTGFADTQGTDPAAVPQPIVSALSTQSVGGQWQLAGQVFGAATYVFSHTQFDEAGPLAMTIAIEPDGARTVAPGPPSAGPLVAVDDAAAGILVTLQDPDPAAIQGRVQMVTVTPSCTGVGVTATPPGAPASVLPTTLAGGACQFGVDPAQPGTWAFAFAAPPHHQFFTPLVPPGPPAPTGLSRFVPPDTTVNDVTTTLVELARIDVRVQDTAGNPISVSGVRPTVSVQLTPTVIGDPVFTSRSAVVDANGETIFDDLPVNLIDPISFSTRYQLGVAMPGYDTSVPIAPLDLQAGENPSVVIILLPQFGTITGTVLGRVNPTTDEPLPLGTLSVTATRVALLTGAPVVGEPAIPAVVDPDDPLGFLVSGQPGFYRIDVAHPFFRPVPIQVPTPAGLPAPPGTYAMQNDTENALAPPFILEIEPGTINLRVVDDLDGPLTGVTVTVDDPDAQLSPGAGNYVIANLTPGAVLLDLRLRQGTPPDDTNFPVIATITVPRGATPAERIVNVRAVMPRVGGSITGAVLARNTEGDLFPLPPVTLERSYTPPDPTVGVVTVDNQADEGDLLDPPDPAVTVDSGGTAVAVRFDFADVATGVHQLTASALPGYTTPTIPDAIVSGLTTANAGTVEYVALPVELVVPVTSSAGGAPLVDAVVTLSPPVGAARPSSSEDPPGTFHFAGVIPDPLPYTLNVSSTLYGSQAVTVPVLPDEDGDGILTVPVVLNPTQASISGRAQKQEAVGQAAIDLNNEGTVRLFKLAGPGDTVGVEVTTTTPVAGRYEFLVGETGGYRVQVELAVHATRGAPPVTGVQLGQFRTVEDIVVPRTATAAITVLGDAATAPSLQVVVTQPAGSGLTFSRLLDTFTVAGLDPDVNYRFEVRATGFVTVVVPDTGPLNPEIGGSSTYTVTPAHVMAVVVTTEDASGNETRATVDVRIPSGTVVASLTGTGASNTYLFVGLPAGAGDVVVSAAGYRTRTVAFANSHATISLPVLIRPLATVGGTVRAGGVARPNVTVTATDGTTTLTDATDASGVYSIPGLNTGTWTVSAAEDGVGAASGSLVVTPESTTTPVIDLPLTPRSRTWEFTVTSGGTAVSGANVTLSGGPPVPTDASGVASVSALENSSLAWTVTSAAHITQSGTATLTALTVPVVLVPRPPITGTVTNAAGTVFVEGVNVYVCAVAATLCDAATDLTTTTSGTLGSFTTPAVLDAGTYEVRAVGATASPEATVTVTTAGAVSPASVTLALA